LGRDAERWQEVLSDTGTLQMSRIRFSEVALIGALLKCHRFEGLLVIAPFVKEAAEGKLLPLERLGKPEGDEAVGMGVGEGAEEDAVNDAEDGGGGADADAERGDDGEGEDWVAAETSEGVADVLGNGGEPPAGTLLVALLAGALDAAELDEGLAMGFGGGHSDGQVAVSGLGDVEAELVVKLGLGAGSEEEAEAG
jgi:hypothetical protein